MTPASAQLLIRFGLEQPIFQAGMGWVTGGRLAAAVSATGGLGVIATGGYMTAVELRGHIDRVRQEVPDRPFGVNVLLPAAAGRLDGFANQRLLREQLDVAFRARVPVLLCGLGDPSAVLAEAHAVGTRVVAVVGSARAALKCARTGVDAVIVQGHEAGGHVGALGTLTLGQAALGAIGGDCPILFAGGVATASAVRACLAGGASGVSVGTRFIASEEADAHPRYKQAVVDAGERDTVVSRACTGKPSRALRNAFTTRWESREAEIPGYPEQARAQFWRARAGAVDGNLTEGFLPVGQCAAVIDDVLPAAAIVDQLAAGVTS